MSTFAPGVKPCIMVMVLPPLWPNAGAAAKADRPASAARRVILVVILVSRSPVALVWRGLDPIASLTEDALAGRCQFCKAPRQHVGREGQPAVLLAHDTVDD